MKLAEREPLQLAPAWLRYCGLGVVVATFALIGLGSVVTTIRVGMADPKWPTVPWALFFIDWKASSLGFLVEHGHRLAGFIVGGLMALFTLAVWWQEPRPWLRRLGLAGLLGLLVAFGMLHSDLIRQIKVHDQQFGERAGEVPLDPVWPWTAITAAFFCFGFTLACGIAGLGAAGARVRLAVLFLLGAVMVQGLLGGLRVMLNALLGTDLATVHGVFAQVIFAGLVGVVAVTFAAPRRAGESLPRGMQAHAWGMVGLLLVQLIWGAILRHQGWILMQRLHFLTAFVVLAGLLVLILNIFNRPAARAVLGRWAIFLGILLGLQLTLGVEAWLSKFSQGILPELQLLPTNALELTIRTLHVLVGASLLATTAALAVRMSLLTPAVAVEEQAPVAVPNQERSNPVGITA